MKYLLAALLLVPLPAFAQGEDKGDCPDASSTSEIVVCLNELYSTAQLEMQVRLDGLVAGMASSNRVAALNAAQAVWKAFRQLECESQALIAEGGTLANVLGASCYLHMTRDRIVALNAYDQTN
ncbi:lysozyme inhibitor LprI family protein [Ketogulonicigenium vulgare]|uniref:Lysozyme inhibitor LprI-like N-terminal domain-containing protein n=1 Tax=Ketogulonicigenium vulgare (strain WSH-001) TaxID=759362 RepID=F9Y8J9_KETVW|nr:lysozyme inhibitor LprI family protein [Ketogulonicigenium vulgare]ADO41774.1 conserved hypothetical protein [Ketogulonicigenium vulgare Y25]AEM40008.1 hypothetical protein KVU_0170 [Ketogulonicigenium vulgare WSH-001]ALJ80213.1 hypothetical protein KVH_02895 [Ketogulonicigenium vulgare]ANW33075.1 hypothetical protein KvSKV_02890 [Ketogulonicigenium vulgare]AOZ53706.1 putative periplasmic protein [Ketogulonicigenium vulgare]